MAIQDFQVSRILSYVLHPVIIPTFIITTLMLRPDLYTIIIPFMYKLWFIMVVFLFTLVIPVSSIILLQKFKLISSLELQNRKERTMPILLTSASYMALMFTIKATNVPPLFLYVLYSATFALLAGLFINLLYKISLHTLGWGALAATLTAVSLRIGAPLLNLIIISILLGGIAGYARLQQNAHNNSQVYLGYITGVVVIILISFLA
jgi:hypothetical protein